MVVDDGVVQWVGTTGSAPATDEAVDVEGRSVIPGFVDSHSHIVFAGDRSEEFAARMTGEPYTAGGIRTTVAATRAASDEELTAHLPRLSAELTRHATSTRESNCGYALNVAVEKRALSVPRQYTDETSILGAHIVAPEFGDDPAAYVDLVTGEMLQACASHA